MIWASNSFSVLGRVLAYIFGFGPEIDSPLTTVLSTVKTASDQWKTLNLSNLEEEIIVKN